MFSLLSKFFTVALAEEEVVEEKAETTEEESKEQPLIASPTVTEEEEEEIVVETAPYDVRIPSQNQAKYCFTKYEEFYKCQGEKGEGDSACLKYKKAYKSFCPVEWVDQWEELRGEGRFYGKY